MRDCIRTYEKILNSLANHTASVGSSILEGSSDNMLFGYFFRIGSYVDIVEKMGGQR